MKRKKMNGILLRRALISKILVFVLVLSSLFVPQGTVAVYAGNGGDALPEITATPADSPLFGDAD